MYSTVLMLHAILRWVVVLAGLLAVVRALSGTFGRKPWTGADDGTGRAFVMALDVQFLVGLILYAALSPITQTAFRDFGAAMRTPALRYWAVEHVTGMVIALALAHIGRARLRRADGVARHRTAAVFFGLALLALLASIPWPGMPNGRPWLW